MSPSFSLFWGKTDNDFSPKDERDHPDFHQRQVQKQTSVLVLGCISASGMGDLHLCEGITDMEAYIWIYRDINCHRDDIFPGKQDNARPHSAHAKTEWFLDTLHHRRDVPYCLPAVQICLLLKMYDPS